MDITQELIENKLIHMEGDMRSISQQLSLLQKFMRFNFGEQFKNFIELETQSKQKRSRLFEKTNMNSSGASRNISNPRYAGVQQRVAITVEKIQNPSNSQSTLHQDEEEEMNNSNNDGINSCATDFFCNEQNNEAASSNNYANNEFVETLPNNYIVLEGDEEAEQKYVPEDSKMVFPKDIEDPLSQEQDYDESQQFVVQEHYAEEESEITEETGMSESHPPSTFNESQNQGGSTQESRRPIFYNAIGKNLGGRRKKVNLLNPCPIIPSPLRIDKSLSQNASKDVTLKSGRLGKQCLICKKLFTHSSSFERHVKIHTNEKPFKCSICPAAYYRKDHLNRHEHQHLKNANQPKKCPHCRFQYKEDGFLKEHIKKFHHYTPNM